MAQQTKRTDEFPPIRHRGVRFAPHEDLYHFVLTRPWWQFFVLCFLGMTGVVVVFAGLYTLEHDSIRGARPGNFEDALAFSLETFATIGYGGMTPNSRFAHGLVHFESFVGMLSVALITGITFAKFARPTARVLFTDKLCVAPRDGVPHLMIRMANMRGNMVVEAQLRLILLVFERTREGESIRIPTELPLVRDRTALFPLSWTALHRIDDASPLAGEGVMERLRAKQGELFASFTGYDETIAQTIHARRSYKLDDIVWGARFGDVLTVHPDGTRELDFTHFHEVVPIEEPKEPRRTP